MTKVAALRAVTLGTVAAYWGWMMLWSYWVRPGGVLLPAFPFFVAWFFLPATLSCALTLATSGRAIVLRLVSVALSVYLFSLTWGLQVHGLLRFGGKLGAYDRGVLSNFLTFEPESWERSFWLSVVLLPTLNFIWPFIVRRLGPNKSFKPNPLRGSA